jgi:hypothetical protein
MCGARTPQNRFGIFRTMISIALGPRDLARLRFAFSPLWECVAAFRTWRDARRPAFHEPWARFVTAAAGHLDWHLLDLVARAPSGRIPDFLAPPPVPDVSRFRDEIAAMRLVAPHVVRAELTASFDGRLPTAVANGLAQPGRLMATIATMLDAFWRVAVLPVWPRVVARLEDDIAFRARLLAQSGGGAAIASVHSSVRWVGGDDKGRVTIRDAARVHRVARGRGIVLVPSVFSWPRAFVVSRQPWQPTIAYPARGVAHVWAPTTTPRGGDALTELLGGARARLVARLTVPQTTGELAAALEVSSATISEHLGALAKVRVVARTRVGRRVYYTLDQRGLDLVRAFS